MGTSGQGPWRGWGVRVLVDKGYVEDGDYGYQWIGAMWRMGSKGTSG